jgi:hypothetical protein
MLALAILVAVGGYLTIGFAYWAMRQAIPSAAKKTANLALQQLTVAGELVQATSRQVQAALAAEDPAVPTTHETVIRAAEVHSQATKSLSEATGFLKELLAGLGGVFQALGALSPPVAALCVAVLMFLTAGGIEVADRLIS